MGIWESKNGWFITEHPTKIWMKRGSPMTQETPENWELPYWWLMMIHRATQRVVVKHSEDMRSLRCHKPLVPGSTNHISMENSTTRDGEYSTAHFSLSATSKIKNGDNKWDIIVEFFISQQWCYWLQDEFGAARILGHGGHVGSLQQQTNRILDMLNDNQACLT